MWVLLCCHVLLFTASESLVLYRLPITRNEFKYGWISYRSMQCKWGSTWGTRHISQKMPTRYFCKKPSTKSCAVTFAKLVNLCTRICVGWEFKKAFLFYRVTKLKKRWMQFKISRSMRKDRCQVIEFPLRRELTIPIRIKDTIETQTSQTQYKGGCWKRLTKPPKIFWGSSQNNCHHFYYHHHQFYNYCSQGI